ncbi:hypothetical protein [Haloglomus litoreum]|uniref:hypothetical protein n=1 Tax=Haloglomus litoreum TaxID=3034026 RepID=UPI0023E85221|nr:hypothetical protein [Haloglomus sp. DT116]
MFDTSEDGGGTDINPYRRESRSGPRIGARTACELCERQRRCFDRHGLSACLDCHHELLPNGVL